jgi:hypothetical protein
VLMTELSIMPSTTAGRVAKSSTTALALTDAIPLRRRMRTATLKECCEWGEEMRGGRGDMILEVGGT